TPSSTSARRFSRANSASRACYLGESHKRRGGGLLEVVPVSEHNAANKPCPVPPERRRQGRKIVQKLVKAATTLAVMLASAPAFAAGWEPTKPVEIVVAAGAGGASDQM